VGFFYNYGIVKVIRRGRLKEKEAKIEDWTILNSKEIVQESEYGFLLKD
jgi:hypothetical protein